MARIISIAQIISQILFLAMTIFVTTACVSKGADSIDPGIISNADGHWKMTPVSMRIYPSTRFIRKSQNGILEARIELFDSMGDSVKAIGKIHFDLFATVHGKEPLLGQRLFTWEAELLTLAEQRRYYDPITRTYRFLLEVHSLLSAHSPTILRASFKMMGRRLEAQKVLPSYHVNQQ